MPEKAVNGNSSDTGDHKSMAAMTTGGGGGVRDENAVNHEIATLLLNLASRTSGLAAVATAGGGEDKMAAAGNKPADVAMDLSIYAKSNGSAHSQKHLHQQQQQQQHTSSSNGGGAFQTATANGGGVSGGAGTNPYSLFPLTNVPALPSSYLLQNLLIGKMQQQLNGSSDRVSSSDSAAASSSLSLCGAGQSSVIKSSGAAKGVVAPASLSPVTSPTATASNVPLLSGQIVAQLNALLFSIHGLADSCIEAKVEGQLAAIFTRLQEIVAMVQLSKKTTEDKQQQQQDAKELSPNSSNRQLEEFHATLLNSGKLNNKNAGSSNNSSHHRGAEKLPPTAPPQLEIGADGQLRVITVGAPSRQEEYSSAAAAVDSSNSNINNNNINGRNSGGGGKSRRLPPTRGDFGGGAGAPPEKRLKLSSSTSPPDRQLAPPPTPLSSSGRRSSKGGKGIRNRVFCGDCPGCLKNDDCGQCRYCRDKTKFGGQNRLRQKCLHRRCQMDTHRRASGAAAAAAAAAAAVGGGGSSLTAAVLVAPESPAAIYSGLELARLAAVGQQQAEAADEERRPPVYPKLLGGGLTGQASSPEPEWSQTTHQSRIDKWKAKHEAMLKLAAAEGGKFSRTGTPSPPADHRKLVITVSEKEEDEEEEDEDEEDEEEDRGGQDEDDEEEEDEETNEEKKLANFRKETAARLATTARSLTAALVV